MTEARIMASASPLDIQPIKREELSGDKVAYRGIKLIDTGVWTDSSSKKATLYDEETFENTTPEYDESEYDGPPVNIAHDIHKGGRKKGEVHKASVSGYIDPDSIETDGEALFGDVIIDRSTDAGAFADTNLKSALENDGMAGFSPSVELMPTNFDDTPHAHAEEYVTAAELTGLGLVRDPASKSVDFAHETRTRSVALSAASNPNAKVLTQQDTDMSPGKELEADPADIRDALDQYGLGDVIGDMDDDEMMDFAGRLHDDIMDLLAESDDTALEYDDKEKGEHEDEDDEEDAEMEDEPTDDIGALQDSVANLSSRLEDVEDALSQAMSAEDVSAELEDATGNKLADAETVKTLQAEKEELEQRVEELENVGKESKTLTDAQNAEEDFDWSTADDGVSYDPATGSMSR